MVCDLFSCSFDALVVLILAETYDLFSRDLPQSNLGMINDKSNSLEIEVAGRLYEIRQSPGLLTSSNIEGTTGAALWKISPVVAEWLADPNNVLWSSQILHAAANVVELGCGITGLIGLVLARQVGKYILTDQRSVLKLLQENVDANGPDRRKLKGRPSKKTSSVTALESNLSVLELNWETDDVAALDQVLHPDQPIDLVIVCDCVFNDFLLDPLTTICASIGNRSSDPELPTIFLFAQQLRSDQVFSAFLELLDRKFRVWRVPDSSLPSALQSRSGFAVHLAVLR